LIFNIIEVPMERLRPLQASARQVLLRSDCSWQFMLNYIYVESSDYDIIDLQISKGTKRALTKIRGKTPLTLDQVLGNESACDDNTGDGADHWYTLSWFPHDVGESGKWYHVNEFAAWLSTYCVSGELFQITKENGGGLWGWEFQSGKFRELELKPKGRWLKSSKSKTS
jgi:hypothetical protein